MSKRTICSSYKMQGLALHNIKVIPLDEVGEQVQADDINENEPCFDDFDLFLFLECKGPDGDPLLFAYDCEATGGSFYADHIIKMAAVVIVPDNVTVSETSFS